MYISLSYKVDHYFEDSGHDANFIITGGITIIEITINATIDDKASW